MWQTKKKMMHYIDSPPRGVFLLRWRALRFVTNTATSTSTQSRRVATSVCTFRATPYTEMLAYYS